MKEKNILDQAIQNFTANFKGSGHWEVNKDKVLDANIKLKLPDGNLQFNVEVKQEVREHIIRNLVDLKRTYPDFLLVAYRIYPKYRDILRELGINYIEANGNGFIQSKGLYIWIDKHDPLKGVEDVANRAFTKTGLKVFFQLLVDNKNLDANQRDLADRAGVALGNIPLVLKGLKAAGLLVQKNKFGYHWTNKEEAIGQWIIGYKTTLKAALIQGKFRLPKEKPWKDVHLPNEATVWGGEPAADLITNHLRPERFILFTDLKKIDFIKETRLMPDPDGEIELLETFWKVEGNPIIQNCAAPLLVYADLIINGDKRSLEAAKLIYDRYIQEL